MLCAKRLGQFYLQMGFRQMFCTEKVQNVVGSKTYRRNKPYTPGLLTLNLHLKFITSPILGYPGVVNRAGKNRVRHKS